MTIEEAIKNEENREKQFLGNARSALTDKVRIKCERYASEHHQKAEWLKELKKLKEIKED